MTGCDSSKAAAESMIPGLQAVAKAPPLLKRSGTSKFCLFRNLIENAIKYTPTEGTIEIGLRETESKLLGWVKDTGIGISQYRMERLFNRFDQTDASIGRDYGGTGLGLSIAKQLVELMGGRIWVDGDLAGEPLQQGRAAHRPADPTGGTHRRTHRSGIPRCMH